VEKGEFAEAALNDVINTLGMKRQDNALATEIVYGVLRWRDRLDSIISGLVHSRKQKIQSEVRNILRIALYQAKFLTKIPHFSIVDEAVKMTKIRVGTPQSGFVNALLRSALSKMEQGATYPRNDPDALAQYYSHPKWLVNEWIAEFGIDSTQDILEFNNSRPRLEFRVNTLKTSNENLISVFEKHEIAIEYGSLPGSFFLTRSEGKTMDLPGYKEGLFTVQGFASQVIPLLLKIRKDSRVLDACAAPGNKTAQICALTNNQAEVIAMDIDKERVSDMKLNLQRLNARARAIIGDAGAKDVLNKKFDRILVDAPCSGLGTLRHNPEKKYRIKREDVKSLAVKQRKILEACADRLESQGVLLYSVCTVTKDETYSLINSFLADNPAFYLEPFTHDEVFVPSFITPHGFFCSFPDVSSGLDGFFAARLKKN
jgi:16S rRNA (cytosine967-C5)-methyltransferase